VPCAVRVYFRLGTRESKALSGSRHLAASIVTDHGMYLDHYGLKEKPFELTSNQRYIWLNDQNRSALRMFKKAFVNDGGFMIISGEVGVGKTALMSCLRNELAKR
jgi:type II secretory pathway predicted ATPase ExeA